MCAISEPSPCIWTVWERIPENKRTDSDHKYGIEWDRLPCGDFSSQERAQMFLDNWDRSIKNPSDYKIEEHMLDWRLRCH